MSKKNGFTLTEVLAVVVILAVIASVSMPGFSRLKEKAEANQAIAYLRTLRAAERMYYAKNGTYVTASTCPGAACPTGPRTINTVDAIRTELGAEVSTGNYVFSVTQSTTTFTATATGNGNTITVNEAGAWAGYAPLPTN